MTHDTLTSLAKFTEDYEIYTKILTDQEFVKTNSLGFIK